MKKIRLFINNFVATASFKRLLIATLLFGILTYLIDFSSFGLAELTRIAGNCNVLDFEKGYTVERAYSLLESLGTAGRDFYLHVVMPLDIFFPITFMMFNASCLSLVLKYVTKENSPFRMLTYLALLNMLCDWSENIGITAMLMHYPTKLPTISVITGTITSIKFYCVLCIIITFAISLLCSIVKWIRSRSAQEA